MVYIGYTQKRCFHSNTLEGIWGLDGTKQEPSKNLR